MRDDTAKTQEQTEAFLQATRELHEAGTEWLYLAEIGQQMMRNATLRNEKIGRAVRSFRRLGAPIAELSSIQTKLEREERLEIQLEAPALQQDGYPQRYLIRATELSDVSDDLVVLS